MATAPNSEPKSSDQVQFWRTFTSSKKEEDTQPEDVDKRDAMEKRLWWWNLVCFLAHLIQALIALVLGQNQNTASGKFRLPLTTHFLNWSSGYPVEQADTIAMVPFASLTSGFSWMSAFAHMIVLLSYRTYVDDLRKGINRFRWYEYAVSSSLMIVLIAMLFGMYDVISLFLLASVNACMNLFGYMMELHNQSTKVVDWTSFIFGCFAGIVPWAACFAFLGASASSDIPAFVWAIFFVYFTAFNTFPINMICQYAKVGRWNDKFHGWKGAGYYHGERLYQIQSLVSKSLLLWLVLGGSNQPNSYSGNRRT